MRDKITKKWQILLLIPVSIVALFIIGGLLHPESGSKTQVDEKFIVANPLDLTQVSGFSKYRSCVGHDYRFPVYPDGEMEQNLSSMKHYVSVKRELAGKNGVVKAIAPFDGKISDIITHDPGSKPDDRQVWLSPGDDPRVGWQFIFFHIDLRDDLEEGSEIKAGEVIGTANLKRGPDNKTENFDIAVKYNQILREPKVDEPFKHFAENVLQEYAEYGVTPSDLVISKEYRANNPCPTIGDAAQGDAFFPADEDPYESVTLESR